MYRVNSCGFYKTVVGTGNSRIKVKFSLFSNYVQYYMIMGYIIYVRQSNELWAVVRLQSQHM